MIRNVTDGGIGIIDTDTKIKAIKAAWVPKLLQKNNILGRTVNGILISHGIDISYIAKTNITNTADFNDLNSLPRFYKEIFCAFNECKLPSVLDRTDEVLRQNIWFNKNFQFKGKILYFQNWNESGFKYVKDLVDKNGIKPIQEVIKKLKSKRNYLCEYLTLKTILSRLLPNDTSIGTNVNIGNDFHFRNEGGLVKDLAGKASKFFYRILLNCKSKKPNMENVWALEFNGISKDNWHTIYEEKIKNIIDKNVAEFNFKLLHNMLPNNLYLSKWNKDITKFCNTCQEIENTKHMIYECSIAHVLWRRVSEIININIKWKHIVIGFVEKNQSTIIYNNIISFISYKLFKYKMKCKILKENVTSEGLTIYLKSSLTNFFHVCKKSQTTKHNFHLLLTLAENI